MAMEYVINVPSGILVTLPELQTLLQAYIWVGILCGFLTIIAVKFSDEIEGGIVKHSASLWIALWLWPIYVIVGAEELILFDSDNSDEKPQKKLDEIENKEGEEN